MNIIQEKERVLSSQELYTIIDFATQAAEDNGFLNSFVFERALYCFAALYLYEERRDDISDLITDSPMIAWDRLLIDGTIEQMVEDYPKDCEDLAFYGNSWFEDYNNYVTSARGLFSLIQEFSGDIVQQAALQFKTMQEDPQLQQAVDAAEYWGMNAGFDEVQEQEEKDESLFEKPVTD